MRGDKGLFAYELAVIHAALGDQDAAFKWLALAVEERSGWIAYLRVDPRLDHLHIGPAIHPTHTGGLRRGTTRGEPRRCG